MGYNQHYLSHDTFENFENDFEPEYVGQYDIPMMEPCNIEIRFKAVLSPDFSLYTDFPKALQILSCYRRQWLGAYWQDNCIEVIPCVLWGGVDTFDFCFDGIPQNSIVSVSSVGIKRKPDWNGRQQDIFKRGYDEMIKRVNPSRVLLYGTMVEGIDTNITVKIPSYYDLRRPYLDKLKAVKRQRGNW